MMDIQYTHYTLLHLTTNKLTGKYLGSLWFDFPNDGNAQVIILVHKLVKCIF